MSVSELLILITGTIGAIAAAIVSVMNGVRTRQKLEAIHSDTNGNLSEVKRELATVRSQLRQSQSKTLGSPSVYHPDAP